ncbi:MAG: hypothetical protein QME92_09830 [Bacillota bacterium]|nr:hypothetical protein [Bacillota bacterium]
MSTRRTRPREPGQKVRAGAGSLLNMAPKLRDERKARHAGLASSLSAGQPSEAPVTAPGHAARPDYLGRGVACLVRPEP